MVENLKFEKEEFFFRKRAKLRCETNEIRKRVRLIDRNCNNGRVLEEKLSGKRGDRWKS